MMYYWRKVSNDLIRSLSRESLFGSFLKVIAISFTTTKAISLIYQYAKVSGMVESTVSLSTAQLWWGILVAVAVSTTIDYFSNKRKLFFLLEDLNTDELTGLPNHRALSDELKGTIEWANGRKGNVFSVIIMDIDNFKYLNSQFGQKAADEVLRIIGVMLKSSNEAADNTYRQYYKGDEFVTIAKGVDLASAVEFANKRRTVINDTVFRTWGFKNQLRVTVSCGVVEYNPAKDDALSIMARAFAAMTIAKQVPGKNAIKSMV